MRLPSGDQPGSKPIPVALLFARLAAFVLHFLPLLFLHRRSFLSSFLIPPFRACEADLPHAGTVWMYGDQLLGGGPEEDLRPVRGPLRDLVGVRHAKRRDLSQPCAIGIRHEQGSLRISVPQPLPREHDPCTVGE